MEIVYWPKPIVVNLMRILITGITGFAGSFLTEALLKKQGVVLFGVSREGEWPHYLTHLNSQVKLYKGDLCERDSLISLVREIAPQQIYHLAGHADVGESFRQPEQAWHDNFTATQTLYDVIGECGGNPRILYVGSGLVYGEPRLAEQRFDEDSPLYPPHPYGCSKAAADLLSYQYSRFPGLNIIRARPFNHIGPRQSPKYAIAHFAKQIAAIEKGLQEPVVATGNLAAQRDLTDVRDVAEAYIALMNLGQSGEAYNIASEAVYSMDEILHRLLSLARVRVEIRQKDNLTRAAEPITTRVSTAKIRQATGWRPGYSLEQTLADTLNYWRDSLAQT